MKSIPRAHGAAAPGAWIPGNAPGSRRSALVSCSACGLLASLGEHEIKPDGSVFPSVKCSSASCGYHEYIKLEEWPE